MDQNVKDIRGRKELVRMIEGLGYPGEFGALIADSLGTEKQIGRMVSYLRQADCPPMEEIADEMLAIKEDFEKYRQKKESEYYNRKYNEFLNRNREED